MVLSFPFMWLLIMDFSLTNIINDTLKYNLVSNQEPTHLQKGNSYYRIIFFPQITELTYLRASK